jgi:hypothetical protein
MYYQLLLSSCEVYTATCCGATVSTHAPLAHPAVRQARRDTCRATARSPPATARADVDANGHSIGHPRRIRSPMQAALQASTSTLADPSHRALLVYVHDRSRCEPDTLQPAGTARSSAIGCVAIAMQKPTCDVLYSTYSANVLTLSTTPGTVTVESVDEPGPRAGGVASAVLWPGLLTWHRTHRYRTLFVPDSPPAVRAPASPTPPLAHALMIS